MDTKISLNYVNRTMITSTGVSQYEGAAFTSRSYYFGVHQTADLSFLSSQYLNFTRISSSQCRYSKYSISVFHWIFLCTFHCFQKFLGSILIVGKNMLRDHSLGRLAQPLKK
jgi:hypothetical protein